MAQIDTTERGLNVFIDTGKLICLGCDKHLSADKRISNIAAHYDTDTCGAIF
jgi:hypothetical protein